MPTWYLAGTERYRGPVLPAVVVGGGDITTGLVHQWFLDDSHTTSGASNVMDTIGTDHGTLATGVSSTSAPAGGFYSTARAFDGTTSGEITLNSVPFDWLTGGAYSIAGWVKLTDVTVSGLAGTRATFLSTTTGSSDVNMIRIFNDINIGGANASPGALCVNAPTSAGGLATATNSLVNGIWAHFCYTDTGGGASKKLYFNGSLVASPQTGSGGGVGTSSPSAQMGAGSDGGSSFAGAIDGAMYRIEIWSRVLSSTDVALLYATK